LTHGLAGRDLFLLGFLLLLLAFLSSLCAANPLPPVVEDAPKVLVGPALLQGNIEWPKTIQEALANRQYTAASNGLKAMDLASISGPDVGDYAFVLAWSLLRANRGKEAIALLEKIELSRTAPEDYRWLTMGEILLADGRAIEAAAVFEKIEPDSRIAPRAKLQLARAFSDSGSTKRAATIYAELAVRSDPAKGNEIALWALARKQGLSNPSVKPMLLRIWMYYPFSEEGRLAGSALAQHHGPTLSEHRGRRTVRLMELSAWKAVTDSLGSHLADYPLTNLLGCQVQYAYGRSMFKRNQVTRAAQILIPVGKQCAEIDGQSGPKALYIAGKALERKKAWAAAAQAYELIPVLYPDHSMADDGYALGGIAWQESGDTAKAKVLWTRQADAYPAGDMAGEGFWRLAWNAYLEGDTNTAVEWTDRMVLEVPLTVEPVHVLGGRYWSARWRIFPDVQHPDVQHPDAESVQAGIQGLIDLCKEHPASFYSLLASSRLATLAPERLAEIAGPSPARPLDTWSVRTAFLNHPSTINALALARLGLAAEALIEMDALGDQLTPSEMTIKTDIHRSVSPFRAHDRLHKYLLHHPPSTLGTDRDRVLRQAMPNHYFEIIEGVTTEYTFDPRIFHALVREESSFNKNIRSWAGARGLSQLMPATAQQVAGWLGMQVTNAHLNDPETNLKIGSRYLHYLFEMFDDNPFLAVGAYNAGEGNVGKWLKRFGPVPTDEYVEHIPFRETRHYVKRVLGTYQTYRIVWDPGPTFPALSHTDTMVGGTAP
jgi:soluble lytic murein transglycosylase